ncbi:1-phosphatidylinositol 4,5-bisphosphate phosphodiesterase gamma-1-like isoform X2 [Gigantopelta aegis]|uniref:1-phosphatidylinositol 4,5-bisphosphate phosphodiesterase gamma-1-like isoform X2 n=1 Tax=Gigantopelta aegis TaxID=1735272 RepID=UPI001B88C3A8|nr:1-phosphatidylinositol 4,5-bisphosphate phosphodiesterase gamma-1-like isoform X2 [Gigantopelta aegis]
MAAPITNGGLPSPDVVEVLRPLEMGLVATVFFCRRKPERRTVRVKLETRQLMWIKSQGSRPEGAVTLREVKEIRSGKNSRDFEKWPEESRKVESKLCFTVFYGSDFKLKTLSVVANSVDEYNIWMKGLEYLVQDTKDASYQLQLERWLRKEFYLMEKVSLEIVTLKSLKAWLPRINYKMSTNKLRERFQEVDTSGRGEIVFEQFSALYHKLVNVKSIITDNFENYFETVGDERRMGVQRFQQFLLNEQKDQTAHDLTVVRNIMMRFLDEMVRAAGGLYFTEYEFEEYLFSPHNTVWDVSKDLISQDMNQPLSKYWIASSHNTYLTGDQLSSESSVEAYARCLRMGCRSLELDCWDGPDAHPYIYHGHTLTSKIKFLDVLKIIKEHAWVASEYPLILSIENHCSLGQQRNMAMAFREIFGDNLLVEPVCKDANSLPSPSQLKYKIILKHKKLPEWVDGNEWKYTVSSEDSYADGDLSSSVKNGMMYLEDPVDHSWHPHFFVLNEQKLFYTEETHMEEEENEEEEDTGALEGRPTDELHFSEKWFHGRLEGGRRRAEELLTQYSYLGDGTFLVRESDTFVGDFSLSFWRQGKVNHCRIRSRQERGQVKYYLIDPITFDSLYSLITHYRQAPLRSSDFTMILKEPVPQPQSHEGKEWYHEGMSRVMAEDMLKRIPYDGAYLVRHSGTDQYSYAISFRAEGKIKHCRIKQEGRLFLIGNAQFESLVELVNYYERNALYKKMKLKYAVNQQVVERLNMAPDETGIYGSLDLYINPNDFTTKLRVKALHEYSPNRSDELAFLKGAIITNVTKQDGGWWRGDYGNKKQHWFPSNFVEEMDSPSEVFSSESTPLGSLQQGSIDVHGCQTELSMGRSGQPYAFKIFSRSQSLPLEVACESEADMKDWVEKIAQCSTSAVQRTSEQRMLERTMRIAREFSDLIVYCRAVPFIPEEIPGFYYEMSSFPETKVEKWVNRGKAKFFAQYHRKQLSRVYPKGPRVDSSNYDPVPIWNCGSQLLAMNYQTPDRPMQIYQGRFLTNGRCGFVLQPTLMHTDLYNPYEKKFLSQIGVEPVTLTINIIGARHIVKSGRGIASPFVEIEIVGMECDNQKFKTGTKVDNGLNPVWNDCCVFDVLCPEIALIRFAVMDEDIFGDPNFLGHATFSVQNIRPGFRSVPLKNGLSEDLELASLLVFLDMTNPKEGEESDIYASIQELRDESDALSARINELEECGDRETANIQRLQLEEVQEQLLAKHKERNSRKNVPRQQIVYRRQSNN